VRRTAIAIAWIAGTTVPLAASAVLLFGCCVLPFHRVVHRVVPLCGLARHVLHHETKQPLPARSKQEPVKRMATEVPRAFHLTTASAPARRVAAAGVAACRSFIALGAVRCDRDVGLYLLVATLLDRKSVV